MTENTRDLSKFGYRELEMAGRLLSNLKDIDAGDGLTVEFNPNSGNVFLVDEDFRVWMMNGDKIEEFFSCSECGNEGFKEDFAKGGTYAGCNCDGCKEIAKRGD
jgi:hypothetical protein